jgi:hypothetical protein
MGFLVEDAEYLAEPFTTTMEWDYAPGGSSSYASVAIQSQPSPSRFSDFRWTGVE